MHECFLVLTYAEAMKAARMLFEAFQLHSHSRALHHFSRNKFLKVELLVVPEAREKGQDFLERTCHFQKKATLRVHDSIVLSLLLQGRYSHPNLSRSMILD